MTLDKILRLLEQGKRIRLRMSLEESRKLRSVLSAKKSKEEKRFKDVDVPFDYQTLTLEYDSATQVVTVFLQKKPKKNYEILEILDARLSAAPEHPQAEVVLITDGVSYCDG